MTEKTVKKVHSILSDKEIHWVGDGFPVKTLFSYPNMGTLLSPFLMLDYVNPQQFKPTDEKRGVGEHPHRGFETVTIVYSGELEHRDSAGGGGQISQGDVQWMTAGSGIVHEEFHSRNFRKQGGVLELVQLWINLPQKNKWAKPNYQSIENKQVPVVSFANNSGYLRVIAGSYDDVMGPAQTFSSIQMWDLHLKADNKFDFDLVENETTILVVLSGSVSIAGQSILLKNAEVALFEGSGTQLTLETMADTTALLLSAEPLNEPIVGSGPFVMNTADEIYQARIDYQMGKMGRLT